MRRLLPLLLALTAWPVGAQPAEYPLPDVEGEALVVPASSPVKYIGREDSMSRFSGGFVLTGTLYYACFIDCEPTIEPDELQLFIVPDPSLAARLPHWKIRSGPIRIIVENDEDLAKAVITNAERRALLARKRQDVRKRVSLNVDDYRLSIDCDSATHWVRYVSLAKPARIAKGGGKIDGGCG